MTTWRSVGRFLARRVAVALGALALAAMLQLATPVLPPARSVVAIPKRAPQAAEAPQPAPPIPVGHSARPSADRTN